MNQNLIAKATITVDAPRARVWDALVNPGAIKQYMFGATVASDWRKGSPITWKGEWKGTAYEDKGTILEIEPERLLRYSHWSPLAGVPDRPENYHTVTIELSGEGDRTTVSLEQDHNDSQEAREHSEKNWSTMLAGLKTYVERNSS